MSPVTVAILSIGVVIVGAAALGVASLVNSLVFGDEVGKRLETFALIPDVDIRRDANRRRAGLLRLRARLNAMLSVISSEELSLQLLSANWPITETEFFLIRFWGTVGGVALGWLFLRSPFSGVGIGLLAYLIPSIYLKRSIHMRRMKFEKQLVDVLVLIKGAVRAGYSFLQALDVVVDEMEDPASDEFRRVRREVSLGLPLSQALSNLNTRMQNDDLYLVVTAVNINSQVGGNLATMLEAVTGTIRDRVRLFSEVRALTSQQRFSGYMLTLLPFIVTGVLFIINPDYISRIFQPGIILCVPIGALILVLIGNLLIRWMARIDV